MNKIFALAGMAAFAGCCSYSHLSKDMAKVKVDGETPIATYEVVNVSYKLLGFIPLTTGVTWKDGDYNEEVGSMEAFDDQLSLDDNLASVRHACRTLGVGIDHVRSVTAQVDDYYVWSWMFVRKRIAKTSCVIVK